MTKTTFHKQLDSMDCGPTCLKMICEYFGREYDIDHLRNLCHLTKQGATLQGISKASEMIGLRSLAVNISIQQLKKNAPLPCILHWTQNHYVVLFDIKEQKNKTTYTIGDPAFEVITIDEEEFLESWISNNNKGICLLFEKTEEFKVSSVKTQGSSLPTFSSLFKYLRPFKLRMFVVLLSLLAGTLLTLTIPFIMQNMVDKGILAKNYSIINLVLLAQFVIFSATIINEFFRTRILLFINNKITIDILSDFLIKIFRLPISFFDSKTIGDLSQRIADHGKVQEFLTGTSISILFSLVNLVIYTIVLLYYKVSVFFVFLAFTIAGILWILVFLKKRKNLDFLRFQKNAENQNVVYELISSMQEIKVHNIEQKKRWKWEKSQKDLNMLNIKSLNLNQLQSAGSSLLIHFKNIIITFICAQSVIEDNMSLGIMMSISFLIAQMRTPVEQILSFIVTAQDAKLSFVRLQEIHKIKDEDDRDSLNKPFEYFEKKLSPTDPENGIVVENLNFKYDKNGDDILKNINLHIPEKKMTAIVGTSGSGKTTLLKLLLKFYQLDEGLIKVNGIPLTTIPASTWRSNCGIFMQEGHIFNDSIAENIAPGEDLPDLEKVDEALKAANIYDYVENLALKHDTKIGSEGLGLSVGQKQRILIARAIYKNPKFIFFDEATSSLDANNEKIIMNNLKDFFKDKTVITVAHRLSTVAHADNIIVMEKGEIIEQGNHAALIKKQGAYYHLIKNQLELGN